jgi:hypothetical protein
MTSMVTAIPLVAKWGEGRMGARRSGLFLERNEELSGGEQAGVVFACGSDREDLAGGLEEFVL